MVISTQCDIGLKILVVDDEPDMVATLRDLLSSDGNYVDVSGNSGEALKRLNEQEYDLILTDLSIPGMNGVELLKQAKSLYPNVEVIIITGYGTINSAVEAMQHGALNYLIKPVEPQDILQNIDRVKNRFSLNEANYNDHRYFNLIGKSTAMRKVFNLIPRIARMHGSVLIHGESGVGKELVAQAIHNAGPRSAKRFVPIDCGALSDTLLESELFGHKQGSFTGSMSDRVGMIETANGGTLLLDEVGNASGHLQSRLLRVIEEKKVRRIGENNMVSVNVRILAASNEPLHNLVERGGFREDLYYRLSGFIIEIPPLRERKEDIPLLVNHFLELNAQLYEFSPTSISSEALEILMNYHWPGNVRELRTVVDRAIAFAEGETVERKDLNLNFLNHGQEAADSSSGQNGSLIGTSFYSAVENFERRYLAELLETVNGNISQASQLSGASRKTIREKGKKYGLL